MTYPAIPDALPDGGVGPAERVRRTIKQVLVACAAVLAGIQALSAAGYQVQGTATVATVLGVVMVFVTAVQNAWEASWVE